MLIRLSYSTMTTVHLILFCVLLVASRIESADICPAGYSRFGSSCYIASTTQESFDAAQVKCKDEGGYLAEVQSADENEFLRNLKDSAVSPSDWIGIEDKETENSFVFSSTGEPVEYTNWNGGEPNDLFGEDCVEMYSNGYWNDLGCEDSRYYFCETALNCPDGFVRYGSSCYYFSTDSKTWDNAASACTEFQGSYIVEIEDDDENSFLVNTANTDAVDYWTGGNDKAQEGSFKWYTSNTDVTGGVWEPGNPSNSFGGEDCMEIHDRDASGPALPTWNDKGCSVAQRYICERPDSNA